MTKKELNQNAKFNRELIKTFEPDFILSDQPINRFNFFSNNQDQNTIIKNEKLTELKKDINSIENCNFKKNSKNLILGKGNVNSPIMLIGESPGKEEDNTGEIFVGEVGELLKKMLLAIKIELTDVYLSYAINFKIPDDKKPTLNEIMRYANFLKKHISIIDPKIIVLMGSTAMEAIIGSNNKITDLRGNWKEIILKNKTYPVMITFSPSYLIRFPKNKKFSWEDLKKIRQKIKDLKINI